jgi:mRNA-degrading endonuclease YafQ of YafQ-DinJ toxin-antitoxin module
MLIEDYNVLQISRFSDTVFKSTCRRTNSRNKAKVIQDIARLIVPSAEELADFGAEHIECLVEAVNKSWNNSIPVTKPCPQPNYLVGFNRDAFTEAQLKKLAPFIGDFTAGDQSYFIATYYMYFPFLACEVKYGAAALNIADWQNVHSMSLAVRGIFKLFRLVKRGEEINRKILAFSVSHNHRSVRIYSHYAVLDGPKTTYYRYPIHKFSFTALDGKEKWTAYKFIKSVYHTWMPAHFDQLCAAIDELPSNLDFDVPPLPQGSGLSQSLQSHHLSGSFAESRSQSVDRDAAFVTPDTRAYSAQLKLRRYARLRKLNTQNAIRFLPYCFKTLLVLTVVKARMTNSP